MKTNNNLVEPLTSQPVPTPHANQNINVRPRSTLICTDAKLERMSIEK